MDIEGRNAQPQMYREVFAIAEWSVENRAFTGIGRSAGTVRLELRLRDYHARGLPEGPWSYEQRPL
jgi:hypothetical protein